VINTPVLDKDIAIIIEYFGLLAADLYTLRNQLDASPVRLK